MASNRGSWKSPWPITDPPFFSCSNLKSDKFEKTSLAVAE